MRIVFTRTGKKQNRVAVTRDDGTEVTFEWPEHPGLPHDLVHVVVESELGLRDGFWGLVHDGVDVVRINDASTRALRGGRRAAEIDGRSLLELYRAEAVVGVFASEAFGGPIDASMRREMIAHSCAQLGIDETPEIDDAVAERIRRRLGELGVRWNHVGPGESLEVDYAVG
jgi:hypothetical protein